MAEETKLPPSMAQLNDPNYVPEDEAKKKADEEAEAKRLADEEAAKKAEQEKSKEEENNGGKPKVVENEEEENEEEEESETDTIWTDVEKITGEKIEVDFGDVEPDTPQGAVLYAKAYREKGIEDFEATLARNYPREYKALQLASEGLDSSILYKDQPTVDYSKVTLDEKNPSQAKELYRTALKAKNVSDEEIDDLVKTAEDKGLLNEKGKTSLKELQDSQAKLDEKKNQEIANIKAAKDSKIHDMINTVNSIINTGEIGTFLVSEKERPALIKSILDNIVLHDDGNFYVARKVDKKNLESEIQAELFRIKNGNMKDLVVRTAKTENTKRIKRNIQEDKKNKGGTDTRSSKPALKDL